MPESWSFIDEHRKMEESHKKAEEELEERKKETLKRLKGEKIRVILQYTSVTHGGYTEEKSGIVGRVGYGSMELEDPQPPNTKCMGENEIIKFKDIRIIETD